MACGRIVYATIASNREMKVKVEDRTNFQFGFPFALVPAILGGVLQILAAIFSGFIRREVKNKRDSARIILYDIWDTTDEPMPAFTSKTSPDSKWKHAAHAV